MELDFSYRVVSYLIFFSAFIYLYLRSSNLSRNIFLAQFFFIIVIIETTFRTSGGADYIQYQKLWLSIQDNPARWLIPDAFDIGFKLLIRILLFFSDSLYLLQFSIIFISCSIFYKLSKNLKLEPGIFSIIFYSSFYAPYYLNGLGQGLAMSLSLLMFYFLYTRSIFSIQPIIIFFVTTLLHKSGIILLSLYIFFLRKLSFNSFLITVITFSIIIYSIDAFAFISQAIGFVYTFENDVTVFDVLYRIVHLATILFFSRLLPKDTLLYKVIGIYSLGFILLIALLPFPIVALRLNMFFRVFELIIYPLIASRLQGKNTKLVFALWILAIYTPPFYLNWSNPINILIF